MRSPNVVLLLGHHLRRWPIINPTLVESPVFVATSRPTVDRTNSHDIRGLRPWDTQIKRYVIENNKCRGLTADFQVNTFVYHLYNVGPTSKTLGRRCTNVIEMFLCLLGSFFTRFRFCEGISCGFLVLTLPVNLFEWHYVYPPWYISSGYII